MEYEGEEIDDPGYAPEFGAIFMSNMETKKECFRRSILALPPSKANFVKQVRAGMVLFLFEFEKRQLFGVYRATSDGGMNISRHPFISSGRLFPAQVSFAPIWECTPLLENEFREALRENYYTSKKFHFGLSQKQVHHLLQLFSSRKLPPRQLGTGTSLAVNDRRWVDQHRISIRERLKMEHREDDFPPMGMSEFSPHIEDNDKMLFVDDRVENDKDIGHIRDDFFTDHVGDPLHKRKRIYDDDADTQFYATRTPMQSYGTDSREVSLDKERTGIRGWFPMAENSENDCNVYSGYSPSFRTKYSKASLDVNRRVDYERPEFESTNGLAIDNDRLGRNDTMKTKRNSHGTYGYAIANELEEDPLKRHGRVIDGTDSEFLMNRLGRNYNMDDDANPVVPPNNYDRFHPVFNGTSGRRMLLMDKRMGTEHNLDNGHGFDLFSEKFPNSSDIEQRVIDERRFSSGSKMMNPNCVGGIHGSNTSYKSPGHSGLDKRKDGGAFLNPVLKEAFSNSLDRIGKSTHNSQPFQLKDLQNIKTPNSTLLDSVVPRTMSSAPDHTTIQRHSSSTGIDRGASLDLGITSYYGCRRDLLKLPDRKSSEREGCDRYDPTACGENNDLQPASHDFVHPYAKVSQHTKRRSSPPAVDMSLPYAPSSLGSGPFRESGDLCPWTESPTSENHILPQGTQRYIQWQEIDRRNAGYEVLSSSPKLTGLGYHRKKHLTNEELEYFNYLRAQDDSQHLNPGDVGNDSGVPRESVFRRLQPGTGLHIQEENDKDDDPYLDASVDEVMDMLSQSIRSKNHRKYKPLFRQHGRHEVVRTERQASPEHVKRLLGPQMVDETRTVITEGVHELAKETREVEFRRRRDLKNGSGENNTKCNALREEDNIYREDADSEGPVDKKQKRRKLLRPNFGGDASVDAVDN